MLRSTRLLRRICSVRRLRVPRASVRPANVFVANTNTQKIGYGCFGGRFKRLSSSLTPPPSFCTTEDEILEFLAKNISRNVRRMEGALTRVAGYVGLTRKKADLETVQRLLRDILREENLSRITIEAIQKKVVDYYHLRMADMLSRRRPANIAFPRQVAMYLSRILTEHSLQEIGAAFGGRDHGTVIHACKTVENMMDQDDSIKHSVELLNEQLSQAME